MHSYFSPRAKDVLHFRFHQSVGFVSGISNGRYDNIPKRRERVASATRRHSFSAVVLLFFFLFLLLAFAITITSIATITIAILAATRRQRRFKSRHADNLNRLPDPLQSFLVQHVFRAFLRGKNKHVIPPFAPPPIRIIPRDPIDRRLVHLIHLSHRGDVIRPSFFQLISHVTLGKQRHDVKIRQFRVWRVHLALRNQLRYLPLRVRVPVIFTLIASFCS